jgi:tetratricopeptide (TPR) repeat protein
LAPRSPRLCGERRGNIFSATILHEALKYYQEVLDLNRLLKNNAIQVNALSRIGDVYSGMREHQEAIKYYQEALPPARLLDDRSLEVAVLYSLGLIYTRMGDHREALKRYQDTLSVIRAAKIQTLSETSKLDMLGIMQVISAATFEWSSR